tara:strand:+ start:1234 stop:1338 length:105 start_codon:yes stop_codon:yes gene_type:complete
MLLFELACMAKMAYSKNIEVGLWFGLKNEIQEVA